jgi:hypothetical protein
VPGLLASSAAKLASKESLKRVSRKNSFFFNERFGVFLPFMFGNSGIPVWMLAVTGRHGGRKGGIFFSLYPVAFGVTFW